MKCELKGSVNMKLQNVQNVRLNKVMYVPQAVKTLLRISRHVSKGATMGATRIKLASRKTALV